MTDDRTEFPPTPLPSASSREPQPPTSIFRWIAEGLRAAVLLAPRVTAAPTPWQLLVLVLLPNLLAIGVQRFEVDGPARFNAAAELNVLWASALMVWVGWGALYRRPLSAGADADGAPLGRWFVLATWAGAPCYLLMTGMSLAYMRGWLPKPLTTVSGFWAVYGVLLGWWFVAAVRLAARYMPTRQRLFLFVPGILAILAIGIWQGMQEDQERIWLRDTSASTEPRRPRLQLTQEVFEEQQAIWQRSVAAITPRRPGEPNVYGLVFAPYATDDVFLREGTMVAHLLEDRFDAQGHVLKLINHPTTTHELPWATPLNLQRAVKAIAARMDPDKDLLVVYLTSHGGSDFQLAAAHWPLTVVPLTPEALKQALDSAGIRHRVIAISACFSGGWIEPLANEDSLVMTAADAEHTSYGCGRLSELTFFGRAVFDEQLRKSRSFEQAFAAAVPVIRQREIDAGKEDGFSNPQIRVGAHIRPMLDRLAQRLGQTQN
ncbi:Peptidase C13 family protein [Variovorax sp. PBL-E5]|nr:Peptidase C13 family protein [Variovorax sp. PBL-E5]